MEQYRLDENRKFWKCILFGVLTLGIYSCWFWWGMLRDLNQACARMEDDESARSPNYFALICLSAITLGIYYWIWLYRQGNRIQRVGAAYGLEVKETGGTYLLWSLPGALLCFVGPLISSYLLVSNINKLFMVYNYQQAAGQDTFAARQRTYSNRRQPDWAADEAGFSDGNPHGWSGQNAGSFQEGNQAFYNGIDPDTSATQRAPLSRSVRFVKGSFNGSEIELHSGEELLIGRNREVCNFILPDPDISRKHCSVCYSAGDGYYYVTDFSTYGVYVNGSLRMTKNVMTKYPPGTKLSLGDGNNVLILQ